MNASKVPGTTIELILKHFTYSELPACFLTRPLFAVNNVWLGKAMHNMLAQFGSAWSGFAPNISDPTDSPLAGGIKRIIIRMIQTQPEDRMHMGEVVPRLAALMAGNVLHNHTMLDYYKVNGIAVTLFW
jgi:hypothetical protein